MRLIIDRFEGKFAVCIQEDKIINIPRYKLPIEAKDGDCLALENGFFVVKKEETEEKRRSVKKLMEDLKKRNK
ncbi:DUF3006 domain-containing protein [Candidatus Galacturonibacter soehngenii]|uniref:DUF3006 domain-containing protein n=1 Tax=Candidatus Galacturonatibacter soehngenii TaxID=2307010 RepID=A0A7V7QLL1_9FIRM|nr:DUF3006 domain-containing protein [Candidatus Galacturonibacter soehngenii]KAB1439404.1 DUF3006 domain-containing protein [Candidatus Galacturonibacter soehngenii]MBA4687266.1 DUF3006 domain-containing protein [Candidatus Galacturonibacter soehngenii]